MRFSLFHVTGSNDMIATAKSNVDIISTEPVSIFHFNDLSDTTAHIVFNIKDEYQIGSKMVGSQLNFPINQYLNTFYHKHAKYIFIEYQNDVYCEEISKMLNHFGVELNREILDDQTIIKLIEKLNGTIKKIEMTDDQNEDHYFNSMSNDELKTKINEKLTIDYVSLITSNQYVTIQKPEKISVDNSDLVYLKKFIEDVSDVLDQDYA